jgi:hypothetical protein
LDKGTQALQDNQWDLAAIYFDKAMSFPLSRGAGAAGLYASSLLLNNPELYHSPLEQRFSVRKQVIAASLHSFLELGLHEQGEAYRLFLQNQCSEEELRQYHAFFAMFALGSRKLAEARSLVASFPKESSFPELRKAVAETVMRIEREGEAAVLLDRSGHKIAVYNFRTNRFEFLIPALFAAWPDLNREGLAQVLLNPSRLTLDLNVQRAVHQAMRGFQGAMVVADPSTGDLLAAYGSKEISPFHTLFEPGSVVKIMTLAGVLENQIDLSRYAPKHYASMERIGGQLFYDWTEHGTLDSVADGIAVSCNLMFAHMGIDLGWPLLSRQFRTFLDPTRFSPQWFQWNPGRVTREPQGPYELGRCAIGLDFLETSVAGLVQIPMAIANEGRLPRLNALKSRENFLGHPLSGLPQAQSMPGDLPHLFNAATTRQLKEALERSVTFDRGTARRAHVEGLRVFLKTGTAGSRPFDAIMIGYLNEHSPQLAFAFFLSQAGKCEINGALVTKRFQEQIAALAPNYLTPGANP